MPFYKFGPNDIFHNVIKTHPKSKFLIHNGEVYYNNKHVISGELATTVPHISSGYISLYEINVDRPAGGVVYPFVSKNSTLMGPRTISLGDFNNSAKFGYGDTMTSTYPLTASITKDLYALNASRSRVNAIRNALNSYTPLSRHYTYSSSLGDKSTQALGLVSIPSIFYGSTIERGSVSLKYYLTGTLIGELNDDAQRGELIQVGPYGSPGSGSVAGVVLYNEGFVVLTGSWALNPNVQELQDGASNDYSRWYYFAQGMSGSVKVRNSSYELEFNGTNPVPVMTMLAHAPKGELNYSSNMTYIEHGQNTTPLTGTYDYIENEKLNLKNTVSSSYADPTGSFRKQTFISKVAIYDDKKNLIGIAKLATPVKKTEDRDFTFKLKLDF